MTLFLCGDVMTGRGIDQILPHPSDPALYESCVSDARDYVELAEKAHGPISRPVSCDDIWGDALAELTQVDLRIINLETSITTSGIYCPGKAVHYRMHPLNIGCLTAAKMDACGLANNHVLDWGNPGLEETLRTLDRAGIVHAGAGRNQTEAAAPAVLETDHGRVLLFAFGSITSGIPLDWGATSTRPGINLLENLSETTARRIAHDMRQFQRSGDLLVASIHWGGNWGYEIPKEQITFAHRLVDEGVSIVHGHSSHHVKTIEVYRDRLILYGCGDFLTDYEGISGYDMYRGDLALMYLAQVDPGLGRGQLLALRLVPLQMQRFRLQHASAGDVQWLCSLLNRLGKPNGTEVQLAEDNTMSLVWP